jgi:hypothetical protein
LPPRPVARRWCNFFANFMNVQIGFDFKEVIRKGTIPIILSIWPR